MSAACVVASCLGCTGRYCRYDTRRYPVDLSGRQAVDNLDRKGMPPEQIAVEMGLPLSAVMRRLERIR